jgi:DNA-binding transcriptional LysR family regulator
MHICMMSSNSSFDWNQARAFLVTAEEGSFSAAARTLGLTQPTLGRQVAALEAALDMVLFERIGRKLDLTPAGKDLLEHMRAMGDAANRASLAASGRSETIAGDVLVSVTDIFAQYVMPQIVADLRRIAPQIRIRLIAENALSDLQRREADIAVRHVVPTQPELISRKVREAHGRLYASQTFINRYGPFTKPEDIRDVAYICIAEEEEMIPFLQNWGLPIETQNFKVIGDNGTAGWEMARQGLGLMPMMDDLVPMFPEMKLVLPQLDPVPIPYWLTTHRELHSSKRIRLVYDRIAEILSQPDLPLPQR